MSGPDPITLGDGWPEQISLLVETFGNGNRKARLARAKRILRNLQRGGWLCHWCRDPVPLWRRADGCGRGRDRDGSGGRQRAGEGLVAGEGLGAREDRQFGRRVRQRVAAGRAGADTGQREDRLLSRIGVVNKAEDRIRDVARLAHHLPGSAGPDEQQSLVLDPCPPASPWWQTQPPGTACATHALVRFQFHLANATGVEVFSLDVVKTEKVQMLASYSPNPRSH